MPTELIFKITGTKPQLQDLLTQLSTFISDTEIFKSEIIKRQDVSLCGLELQIVAEYETANGILSTVDESNLDASNCSVRRILTMTNK
jgi:hypothetical protein